MESEEFEQIPWANLVAEQDDGIDRRVYIAIAAVGLLVIVVFGMRMLSGGSQPVPPQADGTELVLTTAPAVSVETPPTSMVIAEADLRADEPEFLQAADLLTEVTAEVFVTDWFTRDGSPETVRSLKAVLSSNLAFDTLPHEEEGIAVTFVEWAKTISSEDTPDGFDVTIAYRAIRETDNGFVRDPVATVVVAVARSGDVVEIVALPLAADS